MGYDEGQNILYGLHKKGIIYSYNMVDDVARLVTQSAWQIIKTKVILALQIDRNVLVGATYKLNIHTGITFVFTFILKFCELL